MIETSPSIRLTRCPLCDADRLQYEFNVGSVPLSRCSDCSFLFLNPQPEQSAARTLRSLDLFAAVQRDLERLERVGELLDRGQILVVVPWMADDLGRLRARVITDRELLDGAAAGERFDACALVHVLEGSRDPHAVLSAAASRLPTGAPISVTCASIDSPAALFFGPHWWGFEHSARFYFGVNTLANAMARAGIGEHIVFREELKRFHPNAPHLVGILGLLRLRRAVANKRYGARLLQSELTIVGKRKVPRERTLLSVIVPVYNERRTFGELIERVLSKTIDGTDIEVIVVESNSTDGTRDDVLALREHPRVRVYLQDRPRGKGNAVREGLAHATGDIVLFQDADLEYDIDDYDQLIKPIASFRQNFVIGSRHTDRGATWKIREFNKAPLLALVFNVGHVVFLGLLNGMYGQRMADPFSMFKVFRRDCIAGLTFECNRFDFDWEIVIKLLRKGYAPLEIPVNYRSRSIQEGKKVTMIRDPLTWLRALLKYRKSELYPSLASRYRKVQ